MTRIRARRLAWAFVCLCALYVSLGAIAPPPAGPSAIGARTSSKVLGVVWNADSTPVPSARVRLRNMTTGRVEATAVANATGRFTFESLETGSYVIEFVDETGKVRALGQSFRIDAGETIATFVRLAAPRPWFAGFFSNAASAAVSAASSAGVTAVGSNAQPATAQ